MEHINLSGFLAPICLYLRKRMSVMNVLLFILIVYIECCEKTLLMYVLYIVANKLQLQWETALLYNDVSHWLGASLECALDAM